MNLNPSFLNHLELGFGDDTIENGQFPQFNSVFYPNNVNDPTCLMMINSHQPVPFHPATIGLHHQNRLISESTHLGAIGFGQPGLSQRVAEVRRTCVAPNRVQVTRTSQFMTSTSTMERFLAPKNNIVHTHTDFISNKFTTTHGQRLIASDKSTFPVQRQPNFRNQILFTANQANCQIEPFHNLYPNQLGIMNFQNPNFGEPSWHPVKVSSDVTNQSTPHTINNSFDDDHKYDGRTLSLTYKKYGPYKCPKCKGFFHSSQTFVVHIWSHYKYESCYERKRRLAIRNKKKNNPHAIPADERLTVVPIQFINKDPTRVYAWRKEKGEKVKKALKAGDEERGSDGHGGVAKFFHSSLKIKEEPNT
ncbi:hypothetical protein ACOSP7_017404 [Xanthoceras sorbifolium]